MRQKRFLAYLAIQAVVILAVVFIFKLNSDVKIASVQAGTLFVLLPMVLGGYEWKRFGLARKSFYVGLMQFWVFFALPILGLRLLNWDTTFNDLSFLGIPGPDLHKYANHSYMLMIALTLWNYIRRK
ncbi:hypothetical protein [Bdellovibrio sp. HCB337]|uniref:hypothetical protein n=1 Tax=Bdellovibrio sp. HCB337 TaxID=3394358 RepID=UPI0039A57446